MVINTNQTIDHITSHFLFDGNPVSCIPFGNGHINNTFVVTTSTNKKYILQEINTNIFTDPNLLMSNMVMVRREHNRAMGTMDLEDYRKVLDNLA